MTSKATRAINFENGESSEEEHESPESSVAAPTEKSPTSGNVTIIRTPSSSGSSHTVDEAEILIQEAINAWRKLKEDSPSTDDVQRRTRRRKSASIGRSSSALRRKRAPMQNITDGAQVFSPPKANEDESDTDTEKTEKTDKTDKPPSPPDENTSESSSPSNPTRPLRAVQRRISQRFNRKSLIGVMSPESRRNDVDERSKVETTSDKRAFLQRQESEAMLAKVNERLRKEGKQEVNKRERNWLLKNMLEGTQTTSPSQSPSSPMPRKKKKKSTNILSNKTGNSSHMEQKLAMMELNLNELNRKYLAMEAERDELQVSLTKAEEDNAALQEKNSTLRQTRRELKIKLDSFMMTAEERDKSIEAMEQKMLTKLSKASQRESKMAAQLKASLSAQSKMETQSRQLRSDRSNLEYDRQEAISALEAANITINKLQQNNGYLTSELDAIRSSKQNLQQKLTTDQKDLQEAYEYIELLEDSDIKLRTAVALVNKQNKALVAVNNNLKQQLGDANAALAMAKFYEDMDQDELSEELSSSVWDQPEPEDRPVVSQIPPPPDLPSPEMVNILSSIPNYAAQRRKKRMKERDAESSPDDQSFEMVDMFAKALLMRRAHIEETSSDTEDSDSEWE